jgi:predicted glutamine amidotransferase
MCGLIGWVSKNSSVPKERVREYVINQFEDQKNRGTNGFGVVRIDDKGHVTILRATEPVKMMYDLYHSHVRHLFLHHRIPTSTENTLDQTHPLEVEHEELKHKWFVMHNGCISNCDELKKEHEKAGYVYLTEYKKLISNYSEIKFHDTESLAIELGRFFDGVTKEIAAKGSYAFIAIATDKYNFVQKIYIGTNGLSPIKLADRSYGFSFSSEERLGDPVTVDEVIVFSAIYSTKEGNRNNLIGFEKLKDPVKMAYRPYKEVESPYSKNYRDHGSWRSDRDKRPMGYHQKTEDPRVDGLGNTEFDSFGHIIQYLGASSFGEVFTNTATATNEAVEQFNKKLFDQRITAGQVGLAEDLFNKYVGEIYSWFEVGDILSETLEPMESKRISKVDKVPTSTEILAAAKEVMGNRMKEISAEFLPLYKVVGYCEAALTFAYQLQIDLTDPKKISAKIDAADPDKTLDEQIKKDVSEVFPGSDDEGELQVSFAGDDDNSIWDKNGNVIVREDRLLPEHREPVDAPKPDSATEMEGNADLKLEALCGTVEEMHPEEIYREADEIGTEIRGAAELRIYEQLSKICAIAVEEGMPLQIPFHFRMLKSELDKVEQKFKTLADIVKATKGKEQFEKGFLENNE